VLTANAFRHLGLAEPRREATQFGLFADEADDEA
jgi:Holliday junction DNA helicase RuvB